MFATTLSLALLAGCASNDTTPEEEDEFAGVQERELYELARTALDSNRFPIAIERLEALDTRYPFGPHAEQAQLELIYAYYENSNWEEARAAASRFIRLHPDHPLAGCLQRFPRTDSALPAEPVRAGCPAAHCLSA